MLSDQLDQRFTIYQGDRLLLCKTVALPGKTAACDHKDFICLILMEQAVHFTDHLDPYHRIIIPFALHDSTAHPPFHPEIYTTVRTLFFIAADMPPLLLKECHTELLKGIPLQLFDLFESAGFSHRIVICISFQQTHHFPEKKECEEEQYAHDNRFI